MKKYSEYVNFLLENTDIPNMPNDEELERLYPEIDYPGPRREQWYRDQQAKGRKSEIGEDARRKELEDLKEREKKELLTRISDMIAKAYQPIKNEDPQKQIELQEKASKFIPELLALIESHPELVRDYAPTKKDIMADQIKSEGPWFTKDYVEGEKERIFRQSKNIQKS